MTAKKAMIVMVITMLMKQIVFPRLDSQRSTSTISIDNLINRNSSSKRQVMLMLADEK